MAQTANIDFYSMASETKRRQLLNRLVQVTYRDVKETLAAAGTDPELKTLAVAKATEIVAANTPRFVRYGGLK